MNATDAPQAVPCPSCRQEMIALRLDAHYGAGVELDACHACHALWVDDRESLRLTPGATVRLFEQIHDRRHEPRVPLAVRMRCPRCDLRLLDTRDRQRSTPFRYWRCSRGHGRFITFFDFLREKDFIRPLTPAQVAELRSEVRSVNCSNCGAPIDLQTASACGYCRTALSMLDFGQVARTLDALARAEARAGEGLPAAVLEATLPLALARERRQVEAFLSGVERRPDWTSWSATAGLVEAGVSAIVGLLRGLSRPLGQ